MPISEEIRVPPPRGKQKPENDGHVKSLRYSRLKSALRPRNTPVCEQYPGCFGEGWPSPFGCWRRLFLRFNRQNGEKGAKIHFTIDPANRNAYKHRYTSA